MRATNFLLSQSTADPDQLMAMGGSWGGFYSWLLAGLDDRFKYIFPTFGCGFLDTEARQVWESDFASMEPEKAEMWLRAFDPGRRAHLIRASVFYQQATNDKFYSLLAAMKTYHRVRTPKSLLLVHNQDHFTFPYHAQDVKRLQYILAREGSQPAPVVNDASWVHGTNTVEIKVEDAENLRLSVMYSFGSYTKSFGRCWRAAHVRRSDDGRWLAEIPVVDVDREAWFYGHAERLDRSLAASSPVKRVIPRQSGLDAATAEFNPRFDFAGEDFWRLPVGDRQHPAMRLVNEDGVTGLAMKFTGDPSRRGIAYWLEGDLIAKHRLNAIEVHVKVPDRDHLPGLNLVLVTDFHSVSEQTYVARLEDYGSDFRVYRCVQIPFADFRACPHRRYLAWQPPLKPLDVGRLCGVGFFHADQAYRGKRCWRGCGSFACAALRRSRPPSQRGPRGRLETPRSTSPTHLPSPAKRLLPMLKEVRRQPRKRSTRLPLLKPNPTHRRCPHLKIAVRGQRSQVSSISTWPRPCQRQSSAKNCGGGGLGVTRSFLETASAPASFRVRRTLLGFLWRNGTYSPRRSPRSAFAEEKRSTSVPTSGITRSICGASMICRCSASTTTLGT